MVMDFIYKRVDDSKAKPSGFSGRNQFIQILLRDTAGVETGSVVDYRDFNFRVIENGSHGNLLGGIAAVSMLDHVGTSLVDGEFQLGDVGRRKPGLLGDAVDKLANHGEVFGRRRHVKGEGAFHGSHVSSPLPERSRTSGGRRAH